MGKVTVYGMVPGGELMGMRGKVIVYGMGTMGGVYSPAFCAVGVSGGGRTSKCER